MIYITKIELKNFQSHKDTEIELDRGLNVIVGNSDSGKTAILRAIKWALYNEPRGDYFITQGEKNVSVKITFSNGALVERSKTPSKNSYYLKKPSGEEMRFEGFGTEVPKEIVEVTHMYKTVLDSSNNKTILNIAEQLDGPFLLNDQPSVRASAIGRLIGVNYIDDALREVVRDSKRNNQEIDRLYKQEDNYKEKLKEFDYIEDYKKAYSNLLEIKNKIANLEDKLSNLIRLNNYYKENQSNILKTESIHKKLDSLDKIESLYSIIELKLNQFALLENLSKKFGRVKVELNNSNNILSKVANIDTLDNKVNNISEKSLVLSKLLKVNVLYKSNVASINDTNKILDKYQNDELLGEKILEIENKINNYNKFYKVENELKNINISLDVGNNYMEKFINNEKIEEIINTLNILILKIKNIDEINKKVKVLVQSEKELENKNLKLKNKISSISSEYEDLILENGICPFCYNEINSNSIEHIKYHLRND